MNYYFPSFLTVNDVKEHSSRLPFTVNSGKNAIRLLLRKFQLKKDAKVLLPLFVCDSLKMAVYEEGLRPLYADLKADGTFWADYLSALSEQPHAVILVHLYGYLHPDAPAIMQYCQENGIPLIHDAAQSFGIHEQQLSYSSGIVYSFGPGKSTTAAGGAIVKGLTEQEYLKNIRQASDRSLQAIRSRFFFKSRIYGYIFTPFEKFRQQVFAQLHERRGIYTMSPFQESVAIAAMDLLKTKKQIRTKNYGLLKEAIKLHSHLQLAYESKDGIYFKIILYAKEPEHFKDYLEKNQIPYFCLADSLQVDKDQFYNKKIFFKHAHHFVELSTEASIPEKEIVRVSEKLKHYLVTHP